MRKRSGVNFELLCPNQGPHVAQVGPLSIFFPNDERRGKSGQADLLQEKSCIGLIPIT